MKVGKVYTFNYAKQKRVGRLIEVWPKSRNPCKKSSAGWPAYTRSVYTYTFATSEGFRSFYDGGIYGPKEVKWYSRLWWFCFGNMRHYRNVYGG